MNIEKPPEFPISKILKGKASENSVENGKMRGTMNEGWHAREFRPVYVALSTRT